MLEACKTRNSSKTRLSVHEAVPIYSGAVAPEFPSQSKSWAKLRTGTPWKLTRGDGHAIRCLIFRQALIKA